ncbi:hypothetical protein PIB30_037182 [Stylosanthes scabra]|uniref:Uncharacterized protein n=1 Tax=Stylosanthes scabra TaxID=79078 RepID=A0ABU6VCM2_9FABA|nr:hypothetical protein [Stylosanthes scabra]
MQVTHERVQERDHDTTSSDFEPISEDEEETMEQDGRKRGKREAMIKATTIDEFLKENGIDLENVLASLDLPLNGPSTEPSYDGNDSAALHADYYNQVMADVDDKQGEPKKNKTRGKTICAKIYARLMHEREEVTFDMAHLVEIKDLLVFHTLIGWLYLKQQKISCGNMLTPSLSFHRVAKNGPLLVPGSQFIKLILYWRHPTIQALSQKNKHHKAQQKFPHHMGPINFRRVRAALRAASGTNEEPKRFEIFIATRKSQKRKELDEETQSVIVRINFIINNYIPACGGHRLTLLYMFVIISKTSKVYKLPVRHIKEQHQDEVQSLKGELGDVKEEVHGLHNMVKLLLQRSELGMSPEEIEAMLKNPQHSPVDANSCHGSTHIPNINMEHRLESDAYSLGQKRTRRYRKAAQSVASIPVLKVLLVTAIGLFLAVDQISILDEDARKKVNHDEQDSLRSSSGEEFLTWQDYKAMPFTQCVIDETLRLGGIAIWLMREAKEDIQYQAVHLDENVYNGALDFNPWRWMKPENEKTLLQFWNELQEHQLLLRRYHAWYSRNGLPREDAAEDDDGISFSYNNLLDR